jgi:hypothetical protein
MTAACAKGVLVNTNPENCVETTLLELIAFRHLEAAARIEIPASRFRFSDSNVKLVLLLLPNDVDLDAKTASTTTAKSLKGPSLLPFMEEDEEEVVVVDDAEIGYLDCISIPANEAKTSAAAEASAPSTVDAFDAGD